MALGWRIIKPRHAASGLNGEGSRLHGSRWTSPGLRVVHASETRSLAVLEVLVHLHTSAPLTAYSVFTLDIPDDCVETVDDGTLPAGWRRYPAPARLRTTGDTRLRDRASAVLRVPSAIIVHERNDLINPDRPDFSRIVIAGPRRLDVDPRVFRGLGVA